MAYLNLDRDFCQHPKVRRLEARAGRLAGILAVRLWCWTARFAVEDGLLPYTIEEVAAFIEATVEEVQALIEVGFIDRLEDGCLRVHDWAAHEGHLIAFHTRGRAAAAARWEKASVMRKHPASNATDTLKHPASNATEEVKHLASNAPYLSLPILTIPEEEEKRTTKRVRFTPPREEEVIEYGKSIGLPHPEREAGKFCAFYESKGWRVGKVGMISWKASLRNWKARIEEQAAGGSDDLAAEIKKREKPK